MLQALPDRHRPVGHLPPQRGGAHQVADQRGQAPHKPIDPKILFFLYKQKNACRRGQFDKGIPQRDGLEDVQPHQAPVQADQAADAHHRQMKGDDFLLPGHQEHIPQPGNQRRPGHQQLHLPDCGKRPVQFLPVVPHLCDGPHTVVVQPQHADQAEDVRNAPRQRIKPHTVRPDRAGQVWGCHQGQEHGEHAVGHVVGRVLFRAHVPASVLFRGKSLLQVQQRRRRAEIHQQ